MKSDSLVGTWLVMGTSFGVVFGVIIGNIGLGIAFGTCFGIIVGASLNEQAKKKDDDEANS